MVKVGEKYWGKNKSAIYEVLKIDGDTIDLFVRHKRSPQGDRKITVAKNTELLKYKSFYCQSNIEDRDCCENQCIHCKEYYKPLEK